MALSVVEQAARNNAAWCDAVFRAHGRPGELRPGMWLNFHEAPPFYPNVVSLTASGAPAQLEIVRELVEAGLPGRWAVKDSFKTLDLKPRGFKLLFQASWICRRPRPPFDPLVVGGATWSKIRTGDQLADWEEGWRRGTGIPLAPAQPPIFPPSLLNEQGVAFLGAYANNTIVGGAIANRTGSVVGISNVFLPPEHEYLRPSCVAAVMVEHPSTTIVGYEHDARELSRFQALGFDVLSPLRIWVRKVPPE